ncbi:IS481 family transposase [Actinoplanes sp. NPDC049548]|uniref:IS481 family transposase n=1 Tax=Actinoplanes sp. NPDC049548 TaxID=3155152 RepID=UPI00344877BA
MPGLALVVLSVVEQRLDAVRAVLAGADVTEVAAGIGVHRSTIHRWVGRYSSEQLAGLVDRSHRPHSSPTQVENAVEVAVAEMRREHPRWGSRRIRLEMLRKPGSWFRGDLVVPSERTIDRILQRQGLLRSRPRERPKESFVRWERPAAMQLWQMDIVGGVHLVDPVTGVLREAKPVTAVDDHSRFCVIAKVVERATARAVCLALAEALARFGVPEEIITDNGKQFTDRFGKYRPRTGEVLFDKICRKNGITHRLTAPASPNQNGKVERFHGTLRPEFLDTAGPFVSVAEAQAAVDAYVRHYNTDRPHQALDVQQPVTPADRFQPAPAEPPALLDLWLPATLNTVPAPAAPGDAAPAAAPVPAAYSSGPIEFDRVVPASGNMMVCQRQFWMGTTRAGTVARIWADVDLIHVLVAGIRVKTVRSHLSVSDLAALLAQGGPGRAVTAAADRERRRGRGRTRRQPHRQRLAGPAHRPGRGDPRRSSGRDPDRSGHPDVLGPEHPRTAAHPRQPADPGAGETAAGRPPCWSTTTPVRTADPGAAARVEHRRRHGRRPENRPRPTPPAPHPDRDRLRHHPGHPPRRRRRQSRATHQQPAGPQHQRPATADRMTGCAWIMPL